MGKSLLERISVLGRSVARGQRITVDNVFWTFAGDHDGADKIRKLFPKISHIARRGLQLASIAYKSRSPWEKKVAYYKIIRMIPHLKPGELVAIQIVLRGGLGKLEKFKGAKLLLQ